MKILCLSIDINIDINKYRYKLPHTNKSNPTWLGDDVLPRQHKSNRYSSKTRNEIKRRKKIQVVTIHKLHNLLYKMLQRLD